MPEPQIMEPAPPLPPVIQQRMGAEGNAYMEARAAEAAAPPPSGGMTLAAPEVTVAPENVVTPGEATDAAGQGLMLPAGEDLPIFSGATVQAQGTGAFAPQAVQKQESAFDLTPTFTPTGEPSYAPKVAEEAAAAPVAEFIEGRTVTVGDRLDFYVDRSSAERQRANLLLGDKPPRPEYQGMTRRDFVEQAYKQGKTTSRRDGVSYIGETEVTTTEANYLQHLEGKAEAAAAPPSGGITLAPTTEAPRLGGEVAAAPAAPTPKVWTISDNGKIQLTMTREEMAALDPAVQADIKRYYLWSPTRKAHISKGKADNYTARQIAQRAGFADPKAQAAPTAPAPALSDAPLQRTDLPNETRLRDPRTGDEVVIRRTEDNRWQAKVTDSSASSGYITLAQAEQWAQNYLDNSADLAVKMDAHKAAGGAGPYSVPTGNQPAGPKMLGRNADGEAIYEDANGVRSYANANGYGMTEKVSLIPNRAGGYDYGVGGTRDPRFLTQEELAAQAQPADLKPAIASLEAERAANLVNDTQYAAEQDAIGAELLRQQQAERAALEAEAAALANQPGLGDRVTVETPQGKATGEIVAEQRDGTMVVQTDDGRRVEGVEDDAVERIEGVQNAEDGAIMEAGGISDGVQAADRGPTNTIDDGTLAEVATRVGKQSDEGGRTGAVGTQRRPSNAGSRTGKGRPGDAPDGSLRDEETGVVLPESSGLERTGTGVNDTPTVAPDGATVIPERLDDNTGTGATVKAGEADGTQPPSGIDYQITDEDGLESFGGPKTRYKSNIDALRLLKQLESEGRLATPAEQKILARFSGWGESTLANQLFEPVLGRVKPQWQKEWQELRSLLTKEEFDAAERTVVNAHYTRPAVIRPLYAALERMGVGRLNQIRFLEPAVGIGNILGLMPSSWLDKTQRIGVEIDKATAAMTRQLYQRAKILRTGFQSAPIPDGYVDVAFTNVPFGDYGVFDPAYKGRAYKYLVSSIHNYYFAKMLDKVRPGGLVVAITSRYTMDSVDTRVRKLIASRADLVGAIRLPQSTFKANAGTEVVTDVLFLRKRLPGEAPSGAAWVNTPDLLIDKTKTPVNEYFHANPGNVLGTHSTKGTMYAKDTYTVMPTGDTDISDQIAAVVATLPENIISPRSASDLDASALTDAQAINNLRLKQGAIFLQDGKLVRVEKDALTPLNLDPGAAARVRSLIDLRDAWSTVQKANLSGADDAALSAAQKALRQTYDDLVKKYGKVNGSANVRAFAGDPDLFHLRALENPDGTLADIFTKRLTAGERIPDKIDNALDALAVILRAHGRVDMDRLTALSGKNADQLIDELGDQLFQDTNGTWLTRDAYLSGNVREKLRIAEAAAAADPKYQRNVDALRAAQPADLRPSQITVTLGQNWVPPAVYQRFFRETFGDNISLSYHQELGQWRVGPVSPAAERSVGSQKWGSSRVPGATLFDYAMSGSSPKVYNTFEEVDPVTRKVTTYKELDKGATEAANVSLDLLHKEFQRWLWESDIAPEMVNRYNQTRNVWVAGKPNGAHLKDRLIGMAQDFWALRPNQKNAIWRVLTRGNTLIAHEVGAGKTATLFGIAMEWKRTGMANKVMMVAPNELIAQHEAAMRAQYPFARIIVPNMLGLDAGKRKLLMAEIANNDWDLVLIPQSQFSLIPMSVDFETDYIQREIDIWKDVLEAARSEARQGLSDRVKDAEKAIDNDPTVKRIVRNLQAYEAKLQAMLAVKRDNIASFDELGIDALLVDEAHDYKNLPFATGNTDVASGDAQRAIDMHMKGSYINQTSNYRNLVFATGTPLTNSIAETWTMMRYLMPQELDSHMFGQFNPWSQSYGRMAQKWELDVATGQWQTKSRYSDFNNAQELHAMWQNTMDVMRWDDMPWLQLPKVKDGRRQIITSESTPVYEQIQKELAERANAIAQRHGPPKKGDDIKLAIINSANAAAVDVRLYNPSLPDQPGSKVNRMVGEALRIYEESTPHKGAQLIFADIGVPGGANKFDLYGDIKAKLVAGGIPEKEIAYIHEATDDVQKLAIFDRVNKGDIRILIGSTAKMGKGANMQKRLIGLHHLSGKYRPDEILQREGRIIRDGNIFATLGIPIEIKVYVQQPLDAFMWGRVESKIGSINKLVQRELKERSLVEIDEEELSFAMIAAAAGGDPRMFRLRELEGNLSQLKGLYHDHIDRSYGVRSEANKARRAVDSVEKSIAFIKERMRARIESWEGNYIDISPKPAQGTQYGVPLENQMRDALRGPSAELRSTLQTGDPITMKYLGNEFMVTPYIWQRAVVGEDGKFVTDPITKAYVTEPIPQWRIEWEPANFDKLDGRAQGVLRTKWSDIPATDNVRADAQALYDYMRDFIQQKLPVVNERLAERAAELEPKAAQLESLANTPFPRQAELQELQAELETLRAEMEGVGGGAALALPGTSAEDQRAKWPLLKPKDLSTARRLKPRSAPGYRYDWTTNDLGGARWTWQAPQGRVIGMRGTTWPDTYSYGNKTSDPQVLADAIAETSDMIDLRPIATHQPAGRDADKVVILGDSEGNIAFINARDFAMVTDYAESGTWGEGNLRWTKRPDAYVVARVGDAPVAVLPTYLFADEVANVQRQHFPGAEQGMVTMYGGLGAIDPRAFAPFARSVQAHADNILRGWRKPKDPTVPDVALHMVKTLDEAQDRILASLPGLRTPQPNNLNAQQRNQLVDMVDRQLLPAFDDSVYSASRMGEQLANGAMLNYRDRRGFDQALSLIFPFHYFWTRGGLSWAQRIARKPSLANTYYEMERAIRRENENGDLPNRLQGTVFAYRDANGQYRLQNPLQFMLPFAMYMPNRWQDPEDASNAGEQWWLRLKQYMPGFAPYINFASAAIFDQIDPVENGPSRLQELLQLRQYVPLAGIAADARQAIWGETTSPAWGGDNFDSYRIKRSLTDLGESGALGADKEKAARIVQNAQQIALNLERGEARYTNVAPADQKAAEAAYQEASQAAGRTRLLSSAGGYATGAAGYYLPKSEQDLAAQQETYNRTGYEFPTQPYGSNALQNNMLDANPILPTTWSKSTSPGEKDPATSARQAQYFDARDAVYAAKQAAVDAALVANPNLTSKEMSKVTEPFYAQLDQLEIAGAMTEYATANPTATPADLERHATLLAERVANGDDVLDFPPPAEPGTPGSPKPPAGSNNRERAIWTLENQLYVEGKPQWPGDDATKAQVNAYYDELDAWKVVRDKTIAQRLDNLRKILSVNPSADLMKLFDLIRGMTPAEIVLEFQTIKHASEIEKDWQRAKFERDSQPYRRYGRSSYYGRYYPRRSYSRRSYGRSGYSSGGWGSSGGYQKEEKAPWIDDVYARDFDRNLWRTEGALRRWEAPRTDDSLAERWRPARYG
ncbi:MAG: DEAD/DEAH box helicase family protein [Caldilineaceae bacterium]|nr:DEAD/DEAH box helicase family protein [Caldilineaceae bacterium]